MLEELERQEVLVYTPSRKVNGKRVVCYDDRYIVKVAYEQDGVIVSNDNYRDLQSENPEWKWFIEQRLLMFSFVNDRYAVALGVLAWEGWGWPAESHSKWCRPSRAGSLRNTMPQQRTPSPGDRACPRSPAHPTAESSVPPGLLSLVTSFLHQGLFVLTVPDLSVPMPTFS